MDHRVNFEACSVFVDNLTEDVSLDVLWNKFRCVGEIIHIRIARKRRAERDRRFAFVEFRSEEDANVAILSLDRTFLQGKRISVQQARPRRAKSHYVQTPHSVSSSGIARKPHPQSRSHGDDNPKRSAEGTDAVTLHRSDEMESRLQRAVVINAGIPGHLEAVIRKINKVASVESFIPLSHSKTLAVLPSLEDRLKLLRLKPHWSLKPWNASDYSPLRRTTVIVRGIPLPAWCEVSFKSIALVFGSLVHFEDVSPLASSPEIRLTIDTSRLLTIQEEITVNLEGLIARVGVREITSSVATVLTDVGLPTASASASVPDSPSASPAAQAPSPEQAFNAPLGFPGNCANHHEAADDINNQPLFSDDSQGSLQYHGFNLLLLHTPFGVDTAPSEVQALKQDLIANETYLKVVDVDYVDAGGLALNINNSSDALQLEKEAMPTLGNTEALDHDRFMVAEVGRHSPHALSASIPNGHEVNLCRGGNYPSHEDSSPAVASFVADSEDGKHRESSSSASFIERQIINESGRKEIETGREVEMDGQLPRNHLVPNSNSARIAPPQDSPTTPTNSFVADSEDTFLSKEVISSTNEDTSSIIKTPNEIPSFTQKYYDIGSMILGMEVAQSIPNPEAVACFGFGKDRYVECSDNMQAVNKLVEVMGDQRKSARLEQKHKKKIFSNTLVNKEDSSSSSSAVF